MQALRLIGAAFAKFWRDEGLFLASGIAFQVLLCLIPFTLLVFSFAGSYFFSHERVMEQFGRYLEQAAPTLDAHLRGDLLEVVDHRRTTGIVGTLGQACEGVRVVARSEIVETRPVGCSVGTRNFLNAALKIR